MATLDEMRRSLIAAHNSGDTITARKLALSIKLMESQPMGAVPVAQPLGYRSQAVRRPLTVGERVQEFGAGVGRGLETQLGGIRAIGERFSQLQQESAEQPGSPLQTMVFRPAAQLGREFVAGLEPFVRDPGKIVEAGQEMASRAASGPQQAGQVFGEMVDPRGLMAAIKTPPVAEMTTYHGTPHVFAPEEGAPLGRFRASQIGTGEGAQAYGHGIYVAESPGVAKEYRDRLSTRVTVDGSQLQTIPSDSPMAAAHNMTVRNIQSGMSAQEAIAATNKYWTDAANEMMSFSEANPELIGRIKKEAASRIEIANAANSLKPESFYRDPGSLYTVDLPDPMVERMLDWDKPLSEQPKAFLDIVSTLPRFKNPHVFSKSSAGEAYFELAGELGSRAKASQALREAGIPGIRYLDAGSRDSAKGTRNFVIFPGEEQNLTILQRE